MEFLICVDDTDDVTKATSTGAVADAIEARLLASGAALESFGTTRHQLLLDERIKYTSHNSSMCVALKAHEQSGEMTRGEWAAFVSDITNICVETIRELKAPECNPGLCVCFPDKLSSKEALISFGLKGQNSVLTKDMAFALAEKEGIGLSQHGGDGSGVIGALCGAGLRLSGYDGWFRGNITPEEAGVSGNTVSAGQLHKKTGVPVIYNGAPLPADEMIEIKKEKEIKCLLRNHKKVIVVKKDEEKGLYKFFDKNTMKNAAAYEAAVCGEFEYDNDDDELMGESKEEKTCFNCLYRRWAKEGFECIKGINKPVRAANEC